MQIIPTLKVIPPDPQYPDALPTYNLFGFESYEEDEDKVDWVVNLAPDMDEGIIADPLDYFSNIIDSMQDIKNLIEALMGLDKNIEVYTDFYPSDGDYNIHISVPITHPIFKTL